MLGGISPDKQQSKKRKTANEGRVGRNETSKFFVKNAEAGPSTRGTIVNGGASEREPITLDFDDEDVGEPIQRPQTSSPDPIDSLDVDNAGPSTRSASSGKQIAPDGPFAQKIRRKLQKKGKAREDDAALDQGELPEDRISEFDTSETYIPKGTVKQLMDKWEQQSDNPMTREKTKQIDLLEKARSSVKGKMKPKSNLEYTKIMDPDATAPSGYHSSQASLRKPANGAAQISPLPLEAFMIGLELKECDKAEWCFHLEKSATAVITRDKAVHKQFLTSELFKSFEYTKPDAVEENYPPIAILCVRTARGVIHRPLTGRRFTAGDTGPEGMLLFKFDAGSPRWQKGHCYAEFISLLKKLYTDATFHVLDYAGSKSVWKGTLAAGLMVPPMDNTALSERKTRQRKRDPDEHLLVYPFTGPGAVNITRGDLKRLEPNSFLNDTLIEYGLKLWLSDLRKQNPALADQVHIYSSFFYKKLNVKNKEQGYQSVRKWTSKIDIFHKKYLIVPINENLHWYLAIICNPEYVLRPPPPTSELVAARPLTRKRKRDTEVFEQAAGLPAVADVPDAESVPDDTALTSTGDASSHTASGSPSVASASVSRQRSPFVERIPDSENEMEVEPTQTDGGKRDENEVEDLLDLQRSCSLIEVSSTPSPRHEDNDVTMDVEIPELLGQLEYPPEPMEVDIGPDPTLSVTASSTVPPSLLEEDVPSASASVPSALFYSTDGSRKGKQKATGPSEPREPPEPTPPEEDASAEQLDPDKEQAYVFTFDSLGSKHPKACSLLSEYLVMEAKDKKGLDQTSQPIGRMALVPYQPNYCDCGVYVLHFARKFMEDPKKFTNLILTRPRNYLAPDRARDWDHGTVATMRDSLMSQSMQLSYEWKEKRIAEKKEAAERVSADGAPTRSASIEDSDDDVIVADPPPQAAPVAKERPKPTPKSIKFITTETRSGASRLRDGKARS
ncbi:hypothetical protein EUX98_g6430 [Antrodiella citrinella]|uniref:Ubiquitin-like protease family profile domain-containing protein n=1 Tax=Antrodiella citrinella TaxID=2447956 RepID=A0A4S4MPT8_9APHY|nr:hypothetical protein EUX98_g6430 [Antrodiella citrinella]